MQINTEYARKNEGYYYGHGTADLAEAVAIAAHGAGKDCKDRADAVYAVLRLFCDREGLKPDIETFIRPEHGGYRVSWESGPFCWAIVASDALHQVGILGEPHYNFDLCFYPE